MFTKSIPSRRLVSLETIRAETELSKTQLYRKIADGTLTKVKVGGATRVTVESYERFLEAIMASSA